MRLGRWSLRLAAVALPLALAACKGGGGASDAGGASGAPAQGGSLKMGAALSMTGAAATYGQSQKNGLEAATEEVNGGNTLQGIKLELLVEDDATSKEQGINVFQRFINTDKVSVIIGPTLSTTATAADPLAQQARVPVLAISNTSPTGITDIGDYIWRDSLTEAQVVPGAVKKAKAKIGFKTAAVLYGNDDVFTKA
ncbi:MAG TPA: ABC transporter substrate-binding protein, partial [Myxococcales bacterium]|nr:ABC transporter substrate-binding protein [Myxococcales bacterium]